MVVVLKACQRCGGDMSYEGDIYGRFLQCVQCSYLEDLASEAASSAADNHEQDREPVARPVHEETVVKEASHVV